MICWWCKLAQNLHKRVFAATLNEQRRLALSFSVGVNMRSGSSQAATQIEEENLLTFEAKRWWCRIGSSWGNRGNLRCEKHGRLMIIFAAKTFQFCEQSTVKLFWHHTLVSFEAWAVAFRGCVIAVLFKKFCAIFVMFWQQIHIIKNISQSIFEVYIFKQLANFVEKNPLCTANFLRQPLFTGTFN